jgi:hypothetical protein
LGLCPPGAQKSLDQPYHSTPFHSIKSVYDVALVEHGNEARDRLRRVALAGLEVFPEDAPGVLNGAQQRFLIGVTHATTQLH